MSRSFDWLGFGSLTVLAALFALAITLTACEEEPAITLRPVALVDPAPADPFDTDPLLAPPALDCPACALRRIELPGGDVVTLRVDPEAPLHLAPARVEAVELAVEAAAEGGGPVRYAVHAVLDEAGREAWLGFAVAHARQFVLVEIGERPVDLVRPLGWARGVRIGVFEDEAARAAFVRDLPFVRRPASRATSTEREAQRAP